RSPGRPPATCSPTTTAYSRSTARWATRRRTTRGRGASSPRRAWPPGWSRPARTCGQPVPPSVSEPWVSNATAPSASSVTWTGPDWSPAGGVPEQLRNPVGPERRPYDDRVARLLVALVGLAVLAACDAPAPDGPGRDTPARNTPAPSASSAPSG